MSKTFSESKKMRALLLVAVVSTLVVMTAMLTALLRPDVMPSTLLNTMVLIYGGAFAATATAAVTTQGIVGDKHDALVRVATVAITPSPVTTDEP